MCGIYAFFDSTTDECLYVGQTSKEFHVRYQTHLKKLRSGRHSRSEWVQWFHDRKKDATTMTFSVLEECAADEVRLNALEIKWFRILEPRFYGKTPSTRETWQHSEATREKIRETALAKAAQHATLWTCSYCGTVWSSVKSKAKKFCSDECKRAAVPPVPMRNCENCNESFATRKNQRFCSKFCSSARVIELVTKENLTEYYVKQDLSLREVAAILGCSHQTVKNYLIEFEVTKTRMDST